MLTTQGILLYNIQGLKLEKNPLKVQDKLSEKRLPPQGSPMPVHSQAPAPRHPWPSSTWEEHSKRAVILDAVFQGLLILGHSTFVPGTPLPSQISLLDP